MTIIRPPAVAGTFYPADADILRSEIDGLMDAALHSDAVSGDAPPKAIIVPHAGLMFSGAIAALGFATVRALKMNGGVEKGDLGVENVAAVEEGCANLGRHIGNLKSFGVPVVVAINHFVTDTDAEVEAVCDFVAAQGAEAILCRHWEKGGEGIEALATRVAEIAAKHGRPVATPEQARKMLGLRPVAA